jgi:hypothetical protein
MVVIVSVMVAVVMTMIMSVVAQEGSAYDVKSQPHTGRYQDELGVRYCC